MRLGSILKHYADTPLGQSEIGSIALRDVVGEASVDKFKDYTGDQLKEYLVDMFTPSAIMKFEVEVDELLLNKLS